MTEDNPINLDRNLGKNKHTLEPKNKKDFWEGGYKKKHRIEATMRHGERQRNVSVVERKPKEGSREYFRKWESLKMAGLPVVPTMRTTDTDTVVMTDLRADGTGIYGKGVTVSDPDREPDRTQATDEIFLKIVNNDTEIKAIRRKTMELAKKASDKKIRLAYDDAFEMLVHLDGTWDLICLDLENVQTNDEHASVVNQDYALSFLNSLSIARDEVADMQNSASN